MSAASSKEITTAQVKRVRFGFFTDDEIRRLSVKRIVSPHTFDNLKNPIPDGLYDLALGPLEFKDVCKTCGLNQATCPGHFGHIELPLAVYNPLVFGTLYKLMRCVCLNCFHFKMDGTEVDKFQIKLRKLMDGNLVEAVAINMAKTVVSKELAELAADATAASAAKAGGSGKSGGANGRAAAAAAAASAPLMTTHTLEAVQDTVADFFRRMPTQKCASCGACNPSVKKQGTTKLFYVWTGSRALVANQAAGIVFKSALDRGNAVAELEGALAAELAASSKQRRLRKAGGGDGDGDGDGADAKGLEDDLEDGDADEKGAAMMDVDGEEDVDDEEDKGFNGGAARRKKEKKEEAERAAMGLPGGKGKRGGKAAGGGGGGAAPGGNGVLDAAPKYLTPTEVEEIMRRLWQQEGDMLSLIYAAELGPHAARSAAAAAAGQHVARGKGRPRPAAAAAAGAHDAYHMFFLRCLPVAPNKFRPASKLGEDLYEHAQNTSLSKVLNLCLDLQTLQKATADGEAAAAAEAAGGGVPATGVSATTQHQIDLGRFMNSWLALQNAVSSLIDTTAADNAEGQGIRQTLEKKEGLFRKNMMGKRVNFAARSVISPDPYIGSGEIGIPPYFAKRLSFPERVTPWNVERLREAVIRGPEEHPGAVAVEDERGIMINLATMSRQRREAVARTLLSGASGAAGASRVPRRGAAQAGTAAAVGKAPLPGATKIVYRHLNDGDIMLTNRQPTLHKPSLMAHRARVLKGERTIRFHYTNCKSFNADFDGDEINLHLPQDHLGRAEGYNIVHADQQYLVPTDGKPLRDLIQDHVISGVLLTKRDCFFTRADFTQLLYVATTRWLRRYEAGNRTRAEPAIKVPPPCMLRPRELWSGKQLIAAVVAHVTDPAPPLTFSAAGKVPTDYWGKSSGEADLLFFRGYLVHGCVDKAQFGKFGLVHAVQELYGNTVAGTLISSLSRLFTYYLQWHGFTCGLDDVRLVARSEAERTALLSRAEAIAQEASASLVGQSVDASVVADPACHARELLRAAGRVAGALGDRYRTNRDTGKAHDMKVTGVMHPLSSAVIKACLPSGQVKAFPANCMSLMTVSGAKGSLVNFSQISCVLGQQELEGRRVPRMASGKTLPCFAPYDGGARSGGFVGDRFLTGLRPQEYYFHCMAGREGLIDTTVKTSRSGYLQRCLVKNLESLRVHYDHTVRDNCDGSVVQFYYGDDGLDVMATNYMKQFAFLARNMDRLQQKLDLQGALASSSVAALEGAEVDAASRLKKRRKALAKAGDGDKKGAAAAAGVLPVMAVHPPTVLGSVSEDFGDALARYVADDPDGLLAAVSTSGSGGGSTGGGGGKGKKKGGSGGGGDDDKGGSGSKDRAATFQRLCQLKFMQSLAAAGEGVGVLAAQSIGEPSTQMTLNTFHMAGRGEANVTLGIPRLREILMTATARIKTPVMTLPLHAGLTVHEAAVLSNRMRKLRLAECLSGIRVEETPVAKAEGMAGGYGRSYSIELQFADPKLYPPEAQLTFDELSTTFKTVFCYKLKVEIDKEAKRKAHASIGKVDIAGLGADDEAAAAGGGGGGGGDEDGDGGGRVARKRSEKEDVFEDEEENEELREGKLRFRGGRGEQATYDAPDEDDVQVAAAAQREIQRRGLIDGDDDDDEDGTEKEEEKERSGGREQAAGAEEGAPSPLSPAGGKASTSAPGGGGKKGRGGGAAAAAAAGGPSGASGAAVMEGIDPDRHVCQVTVTLPLSAPKLLMLEIVEKVAANSMVRSTDNIDKCYVIGGEDGEAAKVQTDGINFGAAWENQDLVDVRRITTNDIYAMLTHYGVEAARATIVGECQNVFKAYGIGVDPRHLGLIGDFMTYQGGYRACNRIGIESSTSPFLKMTFETAAHFLTDATLKGSEDDLRSPAARLCVGRVVEVGTGVVEVMQQL